MSIFDVDPLELQNTNAKNVKIITSISVINVVYCDLKIEISQIWNCQIAFTTEEKKNIIGKKAKIQFLLDKDKTSLEIEGVVTEQETLLPIETNNINIFTLTVKMPLFLSSGNSNNRVFTEQNLEEIIKTVLSSNNMKLNIVLKSNTRITMCQFNETDLDFFHKICRHIGIFYFHNFEKNTLVISDDINMFNKKDFNSYYITQSTSYKLVFSNTTVYTTPENTTQVSKSNFTTNSESNINNVREIYTQRLCTKDHIRQIAQNLQNSNNQNSNSKYRVTSLEFWPGTILKSSSELVYKLEFFCFPYQVKNSCFIFCYNDKTFILPEASKTIQQKIFTGVIDNKNNTPDIDENYYVHVKLHFNQQNTKNFIKARVAQTNAGNEYGSWHIPRGGQEVIVMFMDEILSYAVIIGSLYSNDILPHYQNQTNQSYWRNETIGQDGKKNKEKFYANEIFMDDTKDKENLRIGARLNCEFLVTKAMNMIVHENTDIEFKDTSIKLENLEFKETKKTSIKSNETDIKVSNKYSLDAANIDINAKQNLNISANNIEIKSNIKLVIKAQIIQIEASQINIDAKALMQIKSGSSKITVVPAATSFEASAINIKSEAGMLQIKTGLVKSNMFLISSQTCLIQSSSTMIIGMTAFL